MIAKGSPVEELRAIALDATTRLALILATGGEAFSGTWVRLANATLDARSKSPERALADLVGALDAAWRQPPDAFPDAAVALDWAMALRPALRAAVDAAPSPVPGPGQPRGKGLTRNGRKLLDALDAHGTLRRGDLARQARLWRGSANRSLDRLLRDRLVTEGAGGIRRT